MRNCFKWNQFRFHGSTQPIHCTGEKMRGSYCKRFYSLNKLSWCTASFANSPHVSPQDQKWQHVVFSLPMLLPRGWLTFQKSFSQCVSSLRWATETLGNVKPQDDLATSGLGTRNNRRGGPLNQTKQNRVVPLSPHQNCIVFGRCGIWRLACLKTVPMPGNFRVQQLKATQMRLKGVRGKKLFVHVSCRVICARLPTGSCA